MSESDENRVLYNTVALGIDAERFFETPVGRWIALRADEERIDALADLVDVAPNEPEAIRALQSTIKRAESVRVWIAEAIEAGKNAEATLVQGE